MSHLTRRLVMASFCMLLLGSATHLHAQTASLNTTNLTFENVAVGNTSTKFVVVKNTGTDSLVITSVSAPSTPFSEVNGCSAPLAPTKTCMISVTFSPVVAGTFSGSIKIADNASGSPQLISLKGIGVPQATLSPTPLIFGLVGVGSKSAAETETLQNNLNTSLSITSISASGDFAVPGNPCGSSVPAGGQCQIAVTFTPSQLGIRSGTLTVRDSANNSPQIISLVGTGTFAGLMSISVTPANVSIPVGSNEQFTAMGSFPTGILLNLTKLVYWSSSAYSVAAFSKPLGSPGLASGKAAGATTITAISLNGISGSTSLTVTSGGKTNQTISLTGTPANAVYGTSFAVSASASSGLPVTIIPSGVCTLSGSTVTMTSGTGTCTLTASQAGNATYNAAPNVTNSVTAQQATATLTLSNLAQTYDGTGKSVIVTTSPAGLGGVSVTYNGSATVPIKAGSYTVLASLSNANYTAIPVNGTLVIGKAAATVTLSNLMQTYTGSALTPTATTVPATAGVTWTGAPDTAAGTYSVTATVSDTNYTGSVSGSFVITKVPASVTPTAASKSYGAADPAFTGTLTGFLAGDGVTATYSRTAGETVTGSPYTISATLATTAALTNYNITYNTAAFTISQATPVITWATPAPITSGTQLSGTQLNATASVPGTFVYSPLAGTAPAVGTDTLSVTFTPNDTADYTTATTTVLLTVTSVNGFKPVGNMNLPRDPHTATLLSSGLVLMAGGLSVTGQLNSALNSAELYDPSTQAFPATDTYTLVSAHAYHTATTLNDGTVLIAGGVDGTGKPTAVAEIYNPATKVFTAVNVMNTARYRHTATVLSNGMVLIAGGEDANGAPLASAELYDPASQTFTPISTPGGSLSVARYAHTATMLNTGKILFAGGYGATGELNSAELFDPSTLTFAFTSVAGVPPTTTSLSVARYQHTATLLNSGLVLIVGGSDSSGNPIANGTEVYDPVAGTFAYAGLAPTYAGLITPRFSHSATLLRDGTVLVAGGSVDNAGTLTASAEVYDPTVGHFSPAASPLGTARSQHTATVLVDGSVLLAGGVGPGDTPTNKAEVYQAASAPATLSSIAISPSFLPQLPVGTTQQFVADGYFSDGSMQQLSAVTWNSSSPAVATVTNDSTNPGLARGVSAGTTILSASVGAISSNNTGGLSASLTVTSVSLSTITLTSTRTTIPAGTTQQFKATGHFSDGSTMDLTPLATWTSSFTSTATMGVTGLATAVLPRTTTAQTNITATFAGVTSLAVTLTVTPQVSISNLAGIGILPTSASVPIGLATQFSVFGHDSVGNPVDLTNVPMGWNSGVYSISGNTQFNQNVVEIEQYGNGTATSVTCGTGWVSALVGTFPAFATFYTTEAPVPGALTCTTSLQDARETHTATRLADGRVLITGGNNGGSSYSTLLYDQTGRNPTFATGMNYYRSGHTATLLADGRVLVAGGGGYILNDTIYSDNYNLTSTAEIYTPDASGGSFALAGSTMNVPRYCHTATLLNTGKVLITGGITTNGNYLGSAELYDPVTGLFAYTLGYMNAYRACHTATLLLGGRVLITGGYAFSSSYYGAEIYDPNTDSFTLTSPMHLNRQGHTATRLSDGTVLIVGGISDFSSSVSSAELFNPATNSFTLLGNTLNVGRAFHTATALPDNSVLFTGGYGNSTDTGFSHYGDLFSAELYDPAAGTFSLTHDPASGLVTRMDAARESHTATLLTNGQVLIYGGSDEATFCLFACGILGSAELYTPVPSPAPPPATLNSILVTPGSNAAPLNPALVHRLVAVGSFSDGTSHRLTGVTWCESGSPIDARYTPPLPFISVSDEGVVFTNDAPQGDASATITAIAGGTCSNPTIQSNPVIITF
jgi:MBG domain/MBG domain (YGX type)/Abnormal spindle-like microcephaly-assoc'd, ASPM-SPD-2-Hydin/Bacterial Ig-like domain (group 2)/Galactose oxidase, central domain